MERQHLAALQRYNIVDTFREASFDEIVTVAAMLCRTPVCAIDFVERGRQRTEATHGIGTLTMPVEQSIRAHTVGQSDVLIVIDIANEESFVVRTKGNSSLAHRFYAGAAIETADGHRIGTVRVLDLETGDLAGGRKLVLRTLAHRAMTELELRSGLRQEQVTRIAAERLLKEKEELLARNDVLLREIDHRVKNSLQLVASMLSLQARRWLSEGDAMRSLQEAEQRISGIAAIHEQLYRATNGDRIDLSDFLDCLCASLAANRPECVGRVIVEAERIVVSSTRATKVGLLVNELVTNAFKHAYKAGQRGDVFVNLTATDKACRLVVRDEGDGLPDGFRVKGSGRLGMRLIHSIVEQVGGVLNLGGGPGAEFALDIPLERDPGNETTR